LDDTGFLRDDSIIRTVKALKLLQQTVKFESSTQVLPVATSAVREAGNKDQFLALVSGETVSTSKSSQIEKRPSILSLALTPRRTFPAGLFFDLGGGTLEMVIAEKSRVTRVFSTPLGGLRLTDLYASGNGKIHKEKLRQDERPAFLELCLIGKKVPQLRKLDLVGAGGTVRAIARYHQMIIDYPLDKLHNYTMDKNAVEQIPPNPQKDEPKTNRKYSSNREDRAKSIVAGSLVIQLMMRKAEDSQLVVSTHGLRDGVLSAFSERSDSLRERVRRFDSTSPYE